MLDHNRHHARILISSEEAYRSNAYIYQGNIKEETVETIKKRADLLLDTIKSDPTLEPFYKNNNLEVRVTDIPCVAAYAASNIYDDKKLKIND